MQGASLSDVCLFVYFVVIRLGSRTRDQLHSRLSRKVPHCLMFVCLFVYFVVVYQVGVLYEGPAPLEAVTQGASLSDVCLFCSCLSGWGSLLFVYFVVVYRVGVPY